MMRLIISLLLANIFIFSQSKFDKKNNFSNVNKFSLFPIYEAVDPESLKVVCYAEIPFSSIQFVKQKNNFVGIYQISVGIKNLDGINLNHNIVTDTINLSAYNDTKSYLKNRKHFLKHKVAKGNRYIAYAELLDLETRKKGYQEKELDFKKIDKKIKIVSTNWFLNLPGEWGFGPGLIPNKGSKVNQIGENVTLGVSAFLSKDKKYQIKIYKVIDKKDSLVTSINGFCSFGYVNKYFTLKKNHFSDMNNNFKIELLQENKVDKDFISFSTTRYMNPYLVQNQELALEQMRRYLLSNEERSLLKKASKKEKETLFVKFWKDRDPTNETSSNELMDEFFFRINYANENFDSWQAGWETDRGKIYILFGPPDNIYRSQSFNTMRTIHRWDYLKINKQFIFVDQNGFGDFKLNPPILGSSF